MKLIVVWQLHDHPLVQPDVGLDTTAYVTLARQVLGGNVLLRPGEYYVSPLYVYFLAASLGLLRSFTAVRIVQVALGTAGIFCVFQIAQDWFGRRAAWLAAAAAALTGVFTFYEVLILQASIDPFLTAAALACLSRALRRPSLAWFATAGLAFAIQALNRPNVLVAALAVAAALVLIRQWRGASVFALGLIIGLVPISARNKVVTGEWSLLSSQGGLNLYIGNNATAHGGYQVLPGISPDIQGQAKDARVVAERAVGHPLSDAGVSAYFTDLAVSWIRQHPVAAAKLFAKKIALTLNATHISLDYSYPFFAYDTGSLLRVLAVGPWILVPLGLVGLIWAAPLEHRREYLVFAAFVPAYTMAVALFFVSDRYRVPLLVPLCVGAGAAVDLAWRRLRTGQLREFTWAAGLFVALAIGANWSFGLDEGRAEARMRMIGPSIQRGDLDGAEQWAARAMAVAKTSAPIHFRIGQFLLLSSHPDRALPHLTEAHRLDPNQPLFEYVLGQALLATHQPAAAIGPLRHSISEGLGAQVDVPGLDLARALETTGDHAAAVATIRTLTPAATDPVDVWINIGRLAGEANAPDVGEPFLRHAVQMAPGLARAHEELGLSLVVRGRWTDASEELTRATQLDPGAANAFAFLAACDWQLGRRADAQAHAATALRLDPPSPMARQVLGLAGGGR